MVGFDDVAGLAVSALDHIRIDGALGKVTHLSLQLPGFIAEYAGKFLTDDLALGLGICLADQASEKALLGVDADELQVKTAARSENALHLVALILAHEAVVDKDTVQLVADGFGQKGCGDSGIHAAGEAQQDVFVPDLFSEFFDSALGKGGHLPVAPAAADIKDKTAEHFCSLRSMHYFRMELDCIESSGGILHSCHRAVFCMGNDRESFREFCNIIGVAHPADGGTFVITFYILQKQGRLFIYIDFRASVFTGRSGFHTAPAAVCHELRSIADAQDRDPHLKKLRGAGG